MDQVYIPNKDYKVLVRCMTYNQSKYIEDALNGFAMQQTDFPFVCLVMDDCSTDGEQDVIKSWMARECDMEKAENLEIEKSFVTLVPHKSNMNCQFAFYFLKENLYKKGGKAPMIAPWREHCEYEALCEGDDYWIDPLKLQKQVKFLDDNKEYSMCFHNARVHWADGHSPDYPFAVLYDKDYNGVEIYKKWIVPTASVLLRINVYNSNIYNEVRNDKKFVFGDTPLFVCCAEVGKVRGMSENMSVYRRIAGSAVFQQSTNYSNIKARAYHMLEFGKVFGDKYKKEAESDFLSDCVYCFLHSIKTPKDKIQWWGLTEAIKVSFHGTCKAFVEICKSKHNTIE